MCGQQTRRGCPMIQQHIAWSVAVHKYSACICSDVYCMLQHFVCNTLVIMVVYTLRDVELMRMTNIIHITTRMRVPSTSTSSAALLSRQPSDDNVTWLRYGSDERSTGGCITYIVYTQGVDWVCTVHAECWFFTLQNAKPVGWMFIQLRMIINN